MNTAAQLHPSLFAGLAGGDSTPRFPGVEEFLTGKIARFSEAESNLVYGVGASFYERDSQLEAIDCFRLLVLGSPEDARSWTSLAIAHEALGDIERAEAFYRLAIAAPAGDEWRDRARLYSARASWADGRFDEAEETLTEVDESSLPSELLALFEELRTELARRVR